MSGLAFTQGALLWLLPLALLPLVFHLIFFVLLGVFPPYGEVFDLLSWIQG